MFQLTVHDIQPGEKAGDKEEAIRQVAAALVQAGNVAEGYVNGMLAREQQTSTFLGNGWRANSKPQRSSAMVLLFHMALPTPAIRC